LASLGITQLDLKAQTSTEVNSGNAIGLTSGYTTSDGATHGMADVWFATSQATPAALPVANAAPIDLVIPATKTLASPAAAAIAPTDNMRSQVGGMVDAMAAFGSAGSPGSEAAATGLQAPTPAAASLTPALTTGMVGIVDAMKQFDANGQPVLTVPSGQVATAPGVLKTTLGSNPGTDILVAGK